MVVVAAADTGEVAAVIWVAAVSAAAIWAAVLGAAVWAAAE